MSRYDVSDREIRDRYLTRLAMDCPECPSDTAFAHKGFVFTPEEWWARRLELIAEPGWDEAPEWATVKAQNSSGWWSFYDGLAEDHAGYLGEATATRRHDATRQGRVPAGHDYRKTLEFRPGGE